MIFLDFLFKITNADCVFIDKKIIWVWLDNTIKIWLKDFYIIFERKSVNPQINAIILNSWCCKLFSVFMVTWIFLPILITESILDPLGPTLDVNVLIKYWHSCSEPSVLSYFCKNTFVGAVRPMEDWDFIFAFSSKTMIFYFDKQYSGQGWQHYTWRKSHKW